MDFFKEEVVPTAVSNGKVDISDSTVRDAINALLNSAMIGASGSNPYHLFERMSKVLVYFHIILPKTTFLEGPSGFKVWDVEQFGRVAGMGNDGQFFTKEKSPYSIYLNWNNYGGKSQIVDQAELNKVIESMESNS